VNPKLRLMGLTGALAMAVQPQLAAAQGPCITDAEIGAMTIYAVPSAVQAVQLTCADRLGESGFLARNSRAFAQRYSALQGRTWPAAKSGLLKVLGSRAGAGPVAQNLGLIANLPDQHVRPLVDALLVQEISARLPVDQCSRIETLLETLAPVDPEIAGTLVGLTLGLFAAEEPLLCPAGAPR